MAKEVKKGSATKAAKKAPAKKTTKKAVKAAPVAKKNDKIVQIAYMFFLMLGVSILFVSLTLKTIGDIDKRMMITCLGIALVSLIVSAFIKKMNE